MKTILHKLHAVEKATTNDVAAQPLWKACYRIICFTCGRPEPELLGSQRGLQYLIGIVAYRTFGSSNVCKFAHKCLRLPHTCESVSIEPCSTKTLSKHRKKWGAADRPWPRAPLGLSIDYYCEALSFCAKGQILIWQDLPLNYISLTESLSYTFTSSQLLKVKDIMPTDTAKPTLQCFLPKLIV